MGIIANVLQGVTMMPWYLSLIHIYMCIIDSLISDNCHPVYLLILVCLFSGLLVSEIPMFSLKFKNLSWNDNKISFIFLIICIPLLLFLGISSFAAIIVWYIFSNEKHSNVL